MEDISYPNSFFHFGGSASVDISDEKINQWIKECIETIKTKNLKGASTSSGNTKVEVCEIDDEGRIYYEIEVSKNRWTKRIFL